METPEHIRVAYLPRENETPEQRRKRLASKRAAKHRYFMKVDSDRREQNKERQRRWRETLDDTEREAIREQNRLRQQARRTRQTADDKHQRNAQQRQRRATMDAHRLHELRERERLRARRRRRGHTENLHTAPSIPLNESNTSKKTLPSSPMLGGFISVPTTAAGIRVQDLLDQPLTPAPIPRVQPHHPPIEIAPLQFVLPPASSIQSLTYADRMAPLPQVQNVLPHASTLFNSAVQPPPPLPSQSFTSQLNSVGSLLNHHTLPSLPQSAGHHGTHNQGVLPSLSQLPELLATTANVRDVFDTSSGGFFASVTEFTSEL